MEEILKDLEEKNNGILVIRNKMKTGIQNILDGLHEAKREIEGLIEEKPMIDVLEKEKETKDIEVIQEMRDMNSLPEPAIDNNNVVEVDYIYIYIYKT